VLLEQKHHENSYNVLGADGQPITGHDGSTCIIRIELEKDATPGDVTPGGVDVDSLVGDSEEIRTLVTPKWEHGVRGLMFDIENHSKFPIVITGFEASAGRGKGEGSATYTLYHAVGRWNVQRCPCNRLSPCKFLKCCCGSCPSVTILALSATFLYPTPYPPMRMKSFCTAIIWGLLRDYLNSHASTFSHVKTKLSGEI